MTCPSTYGSREGRGVIVPSAPSLSLLHSWAGTTGSSLLTATTHTTARAPVPTCYAMTSTHPAMLWCRVLFISLWMPMCPGPPGCPIATAPSLSS